MISLDVEWKHLESDGDTCSRCFTTGEELKTVLDELTERRDLRINVNLKETPLTEAEIAQSNEIWINGRLLEEWLPQAQASSNSCGSCSDLIGEAVLCRTVEYQQMTYEAMSVDLIREAVLRALGSSMIYSVNRKLEEMQGRYPMPSAN